ncbi:MAG: hypothetical protein ACTSQA_01205 [Candidatus Heimdallarchaeaceae archaeon]
MIRLVAQPVKIWGEDEYSNVPSGMFAVLEDVELAKEFEASQRRKGVFKSGDSDLLRTVGFHHAQFTTHAPFVYLTAEELANVFCQLTLKEAENLAGDVDGEPVIEEISEKEWEQLKTQAWDNNINDNRPYTKARVDPSIPEYHSYVGNFEYTNDTYSFYFKTEFLVNVLD